MQNALLEQSAILLTCINAIIDLENHFGIFLSGRLRQLLSISYTMTCPPVRGDNPQALACELSYAQVNKHGLTIYTTYISVDLAHHEKFRSKVGKGGINYFRLYWFGI